MSTPGLRRKTSLMMAKDKQFMLVKKQEEIRCEGENIDRPNTKWSFEDNLMVKMNYGGPASSFALGARCLPD